MNTLSYPQVALDFMNRDHAEFLLLRDKLLGLIAAHRPDEHLAGLLDEFLDHTRQHFAAEERLMRETVFPAYRVHANEHERVLGEMANRIDGWHQGHDREALRDWLDQAVGDWFVNHVNTMDFITAAFIDARQTQG